LRRLLRQAPQRRRGEDVAGRLHEPRTVLLTRWAPGVADEDALGGLGTWEGMGKPSFPKSKKAIPRFQGDLRISGLRWFKVWPKSTCAPEFGRNNDVIHTLIHHLPPYPPLATSSHHYHHYHRFPMFGQTQMVEEKCETGFPRFQPLFNNI